MKVVIQQLKCKGYINLLPIVKGRVVKSKIVTVEPYSYSIIGYISETLKESLNNG